MNTALQAEIDQHVMLLRLRISELYSCRNSLSPIAKLPHETLIADIHSSSLSICRHGSHRTSMSSLARSCHKLYLVLERNIDIHPDIILRSNDRPISLRLYHERKIVICKEKTQFINTFVPALYQGSGCLFVHILARKLWRRLWPNPFGACADPAIRKV